MQPPQTQRASLAFSKMQTLQRPVNWQTLNTAFENQPEHIEQSERLCGWQSYIYKESSF